VKGSTSGIRSLAAAANADRAQPVQQRRRARLSPASHLQIRRPDAPVTAASTTRSAAMPDAYGGCPGPMSLSIRLRRRRERQLSPAARLAGRRRGVDRAVGGLPAVDADACARGRARAGPRRVRLIRPVTSTTTTARRPPRAFRPRRAPSGELRLGRLPSRRARGRVRADFVMGELWTGSSIRQARSDRDGGRRSARQARKRASAPALPRPARRSVRQRLRSAPRATCRPTCGRRSRSRPGRSPTCALRGDPSTRRARPRARDVRVRNVPRRPARRARPVRSRAPRMNRTVRG
jgi:hypothetical protein